MTVSLEHTNMTVANADASATWMCDLFGWNVRWSGPAINGGRTVHVGSDTQYLALFTPKTPTEPKIQSYDVIGGLNHVGIIVDDIDEMEQKVKDAGFKPINHADYEPGRRFYFHDGDGIEFEVVQYD